mmetsp:Transcript_4577/g.9638  ORF Transcript_4577/g.9638 Transcript_4577/m.9638 type:complete len:292 (+) Transcript_4577:1042-1917(+)
MTRRGLTSVLIRSVMTSRSRAGASSPRSRATRVSIPSPSESSARIIFLLLAATLTCISNPRSSASIRFWSWSCRTSAEPMSPELPRMATLAVVSDSVKAICAARRARDVSLESTTTATWSSEDPCAMSRMLTLACERELMNVEDTPEVAAIPSPTIATMAMPGTTERELMVERDSSSSKASSRADKASSPSFSGTATVMEAPLLACVMMSTLMLASAMAPMNRAATVAPPMEAPSSVTSAVLSTEVMPLMGTSPLLARQFFTFMLREASWSDLLRPWMTVPSKAGLKMFRT